MSHTHTPAEWAQMVFLSVGIVETASVFYHLTVDADLHDFDPRPLLRRAARAAHQGVVYAGHDVNCAFAAGRQAARDARAFAALSLRDAALSVAALLALLLPAHGGTR